MTFVFLSNINIGYVMLSLTKLKTNVKRGANFIFDGYGTEREVLKKC